MDWMLVSFLICKKCERVVQKYLSIYASFTLIPFFKLRQIAKAVNILSSSLYKVGIPYLILLCTRVTLLTVRRVRGAQGSKY
jgi:hypothetical protein